jgi:hypothetical protein
MDEKGVRSSGIEAACAKRLSFRERFAFHVMKRRNVPISACDRHVDTSVYGAITFA